MHGTRCTAAPYCTRVTDVVPRLRDPGLVWRWTITRSVISSQSLAYLSGIVGHNGLLGLVKVPTGQCSWAMHVTRCTAAPYCTRVTDVVPSCVTPVSSGDGQLPALSQTLAYLSGIVGHNRLLGLVNVPTGQCSWAMHGTRCTAAPYCTRVTPVSSGDGQLPALSQSLAYLSGIVGHNRLLGLVNVSTGQCSWAMLGTKCTAAPYCTRVTPVSSGDGQLPAL
ncbi:hypothetical protein J6590_012652 [Homalodisca vitripennis]|nr:hypothetical protein J6590_012652 [Homalodisca vitripennis]